MDTTTLNTKPSTTPEPMTPFGPMRDALRTNHVYGEPIDAHGVTLVTATRIGGGAGGGTGTGPDGQGQGQGGGGGFGGRPVGAFVLAAGKVRWQPAVDVNRLVLAVAAVAVVALLTAARITRLQGPQGRNLR
jgi:uncharacterized spore protein YtfJ